VLKVPLIAREYRRAQPPDPVPGPATLRIAGLAGMATLLLIGGVASVVGDDSASWPLVLSLCGLLPLVWTRTLSWAPPRATTARVAIAALLAFFAGTGPFAAFTVMHLTRSINGQWLIVIPFLWLTGHGIVALLRRRQPVALAALASATGIGYIGHYAGAWLENLAVHKMAAIPVEVGTTVGALSLAVLVPTGVTWSIWSAVRLYDPLASDRVALGSDSRPERYRITRGPA
jgi:hypothetical protein